MSRRNRDIVTSAGIADATPIDTFMNMQGACTFLVEDDLSQEVQANDEVLHDKFSGRLVGVSEEDTRGFF